MHHSKFDPRVVDVVALRQELAMQEPAEVGSLVFERFVTRLAERLDFDIPREDHEQLATVSGCFDYVCRVRGPAN